MLLQSKFSELNLSLIPQWRKTMKENCFPSEIAVVAGYELQNKDEESAKGHIHAAM